ncbi:helix-turn-helix domain-containing protein [Leptospira santarosai]|uniref:helix-turn-helix domain-containing protein n=1 Tax=Leptospira santarosai TaxID=28183 RepID=UPI0002BFC0D0|nr:XRE family transcriptional regulator [Leptospira santarosai]EMO70009.1 PF06114 domain protein [Leptospira santarosai str. 200403458]EMO98219.1 PF06114 domain protein [Leptospira santarosai str. 200702252]
MKGKFLGFRLREAREIRNLTLSDVAIHLDNITKQAISQYESNNTQPSQNKLVQLIDLLRLPSQYFSKERSFLNSDIGVANFRKLASATRSAREVVKIKALWFAETVFILKNYINFPTLNIPKFSIPGEFDNLEQERAQIENYANELRKHWNLGQGPIENMVRTLENNGVFVSRFGFDKNLDAFSICVKNDAFIILGNANTTYFRSRLDAAHELGHLILHRHLTQEEVENPLIHEMLERQAFYFGAAFLIPAEALQKELISLNIDFLIRLKKRWKISIQALVMRAYHLNLISKSQKDYFFRTFPDRKNEPLDNDYTLEDPLLFQYAFNLLKSNDRIYIRDLLDEIAYDEKTIIELLGITSDFIESKLPNSDLIGLSIKS